jgi:isopentenyl diphosphate isomerase/L-lactate dehydrogenase-like FMN-dependent dehydrogenase
MMTSHSRNGEIAVAQAARSRKAIQILSNVASCSVEDVARALGTLPWYQLYSQIPVFVDGGFRRDTDVYKALALGARAVGIGRPYIYGLSSFGQEGVERVLDILRAELRLVMRQCGTPSIARITRASILGR